MKVSKRKPVTFEINAQGCHICTSHKPNTHGYPQVWKDGKNGSLHRVLYEEHHSVSLPPSIVVRHRCDQRMCINMDHLLEGTHAQNSMDMKERKRVRFQFGQAHSHATLTDAQVLEIAASQGTQTEIAARYGVHQSTVSRIKRAERRKDILTTAAKADY